jgi:DNA-directed RNA polymerase specialized sigma24 family protein
MSKPSAEDNELIDKDCLGEAATGIVEDDSQEAIVRILSNKIAYDNKGSIINLINGVVKNVRYERINARKTENKHLKELFKRYRSSSGQVGSDTSLEHAMLLQFFLNAILELPLKSRIAFVLVDIVGLTPKQAAELIGCDFKVFRNRLSCARKKNRERMENFSAM